ncbi:hypothetical protein A2U01_0044752, partial [Trifolium medium]|nr:hypothetical protein [Trifolium medium]
DGGRRDGAATGIWRHDARLAGNRVEDEGLSFRLKFLMFLK